MADSSESFASFASDPDADLKDTEDVPDSHTTKKQIKYALGRLKSYTHFVGTTISAVETLSMCELNETLCRFYASLRTVDGELYTKKSMQGIRYGLQKHFQMLHDWDICKQTDFAGSNRVFQAMLVELKHQGKGFVKHKSPISAADMDKIQASDELDMSSPRGLQNKVFIDIMIYFCNRGRENIREMKSSDFRISRNEDGIRYVKKHNQMTKNNKENDEKSSSGFIYEIPGYDRCPVTSFEKYLSKLDPDCPDTFWQRPKESAPESGPWYYNTPVGVHMMGNKMKTISTKAGCSKVYTNQCLRATGISVLERAGFASCEVMPNSEQNNCIQTQEEISNVVETQNAEFDKDYHQLREEAVRYRRACKSFQLLTLHNIKDDDSVFETYTGLPNHTIFEALHEYLKPNAKKLQHTQTETVASKLSSMKESGSMQPLTSEEELFLFLVGIRTGNAASDLAIRFGVSEAVYYDIILSWAVLVSEKLEDFCRTAVLTTQTETIELQELEMRVAVDCTALFLNSPSLLNVPKQNSFHDTQRKLIIISINEKGAVTSVLGTLRGHASARVAMKESPDFSKAVNQVRESAMHDRELKIKSVSSNGVSFHVVMPDLKKKDTKQSTSKATRTKASVFHVDRVLDRIKQFRYLHVQQQVEPSQLDTYEYVFKACAYLTNFQSAS